MSTVSTSTVSTDLAQERIEAEVPSAPATAAAPGAGVAGGGDDLAVTTSKLRRRMSIPVDRYFQIAGGMLVGIGVLAIVAGWYGAAHTTRVWRQTPYLMSGGLLGVALVFIGGFGYFAYWLTRIVEQGSRQTAILERIEASMRRQEELQHGEATLVATAAGTVHRPECPIVAGKADGVRRVSASEPGLQPCRMCEPDYQAVPA
jgi:hypothetical protein